MNGAVPNSRFYTVTPAPAFPHISYPMPTAERLPKCCQRQHALVKSSEHAETALKELCNIISLFHCSSLTHTTTHSHHLCLILISINYYNGTREKRKLQALTPMTGKKTTARLKAVLGGRILRSSSSSLCCLSQRPRTRYL